MKLGYSTEELKRVFARVYKEESGLEPKTFHFEGKWDELAKRFGIVWKVPPEWFFRIGIRLLGGRINGSILFDNSERILDRITLYLSTFADAIGIEQLRETLRREGVKNINEFYEVVTAYPHIFCKIYGHIAEVLKLDEDLRSATPPAVLDLMEDFDKEHSDLEVRKLRFFMRELLKNNPK